MRILITLAFVSASTLAFAGEPAQVAAVPQAAPPVATTIDLRPLFVEPTTQAPTALVENAWDFSKPESIPGFGPIRPSDYAPPAQAVVVATDE